MAPQPLCLGLTTLVVVLNQRLGREPSRYSAFKGAVVDDGSHINFQLPEAAHVVSSLCFSRQVLVTQ